MSTYTDFLNLFKWNPQEDGEEEFDIDKSLNDNWDKIDIKLKNYIASVNSIIETFKTQMQAEVDALESNVSDLSELINQTQSIYIHTMTIEADTEKRSSSRIAVFVPGWK